MEQRPEACFNAWVLDDDFKVKKKKNSVWKKSKIHGFSMGFFSRNLRFYFLIYGFFFQTCWW